MFRPKLGLALGGGGPKGLAHIGCIKTLEQHSIPIDYIAGTSAGAVVGGLYAATKDIAAVESHIVNKGWLEMISYFTDPSFTKGILQGNRVRGFLEEMLAQKTFKQLHIPFTAVAADLRSGKQINIQSGKISDAILASSAIPMVFQPIIQNGHMLVDGAVVSPVPVRAVQKMGADIIIAVNVNNQYKPDVVEEKTNFMQVGQLSFTLMSHYLSLLETPYADIVINPDMQDFRWKSLLSKEEKRKGISVGENATREHIPEITILLKKPLVSLLLKKTSRFFSRLFKKSVNF